MGKLRKRGVVVIEIDSGAKPSRRSPAADPFRIVTQPVGALESASYTTALRTSDRYLAEISRLLSDDHSAFVARSALRSITPASMSKMGFEARDIELTALVSGSLSVLQENPENPTCKTDRLTCNSTNLDDQVMTSFALGPQGKARVISQFLVQRHHWRTGLEDMRESYRLAVESRVNFNGDRRSRELSFTRLIETSGKLVNLLEADLQRTSPPPPDTFAVRERLKIPLALLMAAGKLAEDVDLKKEIRRNRDLKKLMEMVESGRANELFGHIISVNSYAANVPVTGFRTTPDPSVTASTKSDQDTLWISAVAQAKNISRNAYPDKPIAQNSEATKEPDPFEMNKRMRRKSGRDFYQAK